MKQEQCGQLSTDQGRTLVELQNLTDEMGYPPTVAVLAERLKLRRSVVHSCLNALINRGHVRKTLGKAREIEVVGSPLATVIGMVAVPVRGSVPADVPILAEGNHGERVLVPSRFVSSSTSSCFALKVSGQSMRDANILDGDVVVVRQQPLAENDDIIIVSIDGKVTIKRLSIFQSNLACFGGAAFCLRMEREKKEMFFWGRHRVKRERVSPAS